MYEAIAALAAAAICVALIAFKAYKSGYDSKDSEEKSEILRNIKTASKIDDEIRSLPDDVIRDRLRRWTK